MSSAATHSMKPVFQALGGRNKEDLRTHYGRMMGNEGINLASLFCFSHISPFVSHVINHRNRALGRRAALMAQGSLLPKTCSLLPQVGAAMVRTDGFLFP